ncbi:hypothetical protein [Micromonospora humi]|uniref:hypothetical protein n=1 Tax=Micromonospora humi TaxID=745366 RepID=UPI000A7ED6E0|nr:hypothetical protein [Micromonospora humi]
MAAGDAAHVRPARRSLRPLASGAALVTILALLFGLPRWTLTVAARWPGPVVAAGTAVFVTALVAFPALMYLGHGRRRLDAAARADDTLLGLVWILFVWARSVRRPRRVAAHVLGRRLSAREEHPLWELTSAAPRIDDLRSNGAGGRVELTVLDDGLEGLRVDDENAVEPVLETELVSHLVRRGVNPTRDHHHAHVAILRTLSSPRMVLMG